eukprot:4394378-Pyramimonas_sp.AAC.1
MPFVAPARNRPSWPHTNTLRSPAVALRGPLAALCSSFAALTGPAVTLCGPLYEGPPALVRARRGPICLPFVAPSLPSAA